MTALRRGSMKQLILIFIMVISVGMPEICLGGCQTCSKGKTFKGNVITDIPVIINRPGRYVLENDIVLTNKENAAVIMIQANNVIIDLKGHTIDMKNSGQTGILVGPYQNIRIFNGKIAHTGHPGKVYKSIPAWDSSYQNPFALDSIRGIGLAIQTGAGNVYIENMKFDQNFIGIGAFEHVKNVNVKNCEGMECGMKFSETKVGKSNSRGGFIVIAPTKATKQVLSENINISLCHASSSSAQFGIAIFHAKNVTISDCSMVITKNNEGIGYSESSAISAIGCHQVRFSNLLGRGGPNSINTYNCTEAALSNCITDN
jgi:hypothetical protein